MKSVLVGFMGAGKSTAARSLGTGAADVDEVIEGRLGRSVQEIFEQDGESAFRDLEEQATLELLADGAVHTIALGGGALGSSRIREALKDRRGSQSRTPAGARPAGF
jgi:shikimate kinase